MIKIGAMIKLDSDQTNPSDQITPRIKPAFRLSSNR